MTDRVDAVASASYADTAGVVVAAARTIAGGGAVLTALNASLLTLPCCVAVSPTACAAIAANGPLVSEAGRAWAVAAVNCSGRLALRVPSAYGRVEELVAIMRWPSRCCWCVLMCACACVSLCVFASVCVFGTLAPRALTGARQIKRGGMFDSAVSTSMLLLARRVLAHASSSMELCANALIVMAGCTAGMKPLSEVPGFIGNVVRRFQGAQHVARGSRLVMEVLANASMEEAE